MYILQCQSVDGRFFGPPKRRARRRGGVFENTVCPGIDIGEKLGKRFALTVVTNRAFLISTEQFLVSASSLAVAVVPWDDSALLAIAPEYAALVDVNDPFWVVRRVELGDIMSTPSVGEY